ncbi:hypothetical protein RHGRI_022506 [Rhododendron griersonianum]|uniref:P-loop containing nucleoside triphosphate hydrolases superfamily protein n=1 Tax=Rhododendron griersonianum TaxID=479676 RepID=A0AAV6IZS6_9ERIC|nr:hypothetical protein RHGRI_022506 [Rhododendron griersonianum]
MGSTGTHAKKKGESKGTEGLIDLVFSWSLSDVLNKNLYKPKVKLIPKTFSSTNEYLNSFIYPLIEETHADLFSSMETVARAPTRETWTVNISKNFKPPKDLYYKISLNRNRDSTANGEVYEPEFGDLIALTEVRPKRIDDLDRPKSPYLLALVQRSEYGSERIDIRASKPIMLGEEDGDHRRGDENRKRFFVVYLTNMITNLRIWTALKSDAEGENMKIIKRVLQPDSTIEENCTECLSDESNQAVLSVIKNVVSSFKLDNSQQDAVLSCIATRQCHHQNTVKLIWGPPGTGKTKTVASLLFVLLRIKCRTLTCAPTNIAVLGVTSRLMSLVSPALQYDTYGLGDIVLFGNGERMKIDDHEDLFDVFLDYRVVALSSCLAPMSGWKHNVESMICLLENPKKMYHLYLKEEKKKDKDDTEEEEETSFGNGMVINNQDKEADIYGQDLNDKDKKGIWRRKIVQTLKESKKMEKKKEKELSKRRGKLKGDKRDEKDNSTQSKKERNVKKDGDPMTFEEFFMKRFKHIGNQLIFCTRNLYTHMPTSFISMEVAKNMIKALDLLKTIGTIYTHAVANKGLKEVLNGIGKVGDRIKHFRKLSCCKRECIQILKFLSEKLDLPNFTERYEIWSFCLQNASLIFCTASSSAKLPTEGMRPLELLVIDEAAQLKECESAIPLQICQKTEFGRSLFERLVILGHEKHLLSVQYRMHPSISLFPKREFYESKILDGPNVKEQAYKRCFLRGSMYGSYSFINISHGKEEFDSRHSSKNMVEVAVVSEIVARLFKESVASKQKVRVGCISPYKAQVFALQEKFGKTYNTDSKSDFSMNVRSVDGFQGGEEDLIIISTVRCNGSGSVGFLSNRQRTNVALTRARHCLWILGNGATLINSGSVWKKLVVDAKARSCFYDATEDKNLAQAVAGALVELNQLDALLTTDSLLFRNTRWKACFSDHFVESSSRIKNVDVRKQVLCIIQRLSSGCWHQHRKANILEKLGGTSPQLLELCTVNGGLNLIWSVDVVRVASKDFQVLKFWDILPMAEIPQLAKHLDSLFGNYTDDKMNRCKCRSFEGNLVVPVTWPAGSGARKKTSTADSDYVRPLESRLAKLSIMDEPGSPSNSFVVKMGTNVKKGESKGEGLIDLVFSWSLSDVLNRHLYKAKVELIPRTFSSTSEYMNSFISPLIEETHADLSSSVETATRAPTREIWTVKISKDFKPPKDLYYNISLDRKRDTANDEGMYEPEFGDLIAFTEVRPRCIDDLDRPKSPYLIALVQRVDDYGSGKIEIRASKPIVPGEYGGTQGNKQNRRLFVVHLTNMITNLRIWTALKSELEGGNMNIIKRVLQTDSTIYLHHFTCHNPSQIEDCCTKCLSEESNLAVKSIIKNTISSSKFSSSKLDTSQLDAVLSCVATRQCRHQNTVKLIWGPPGTGKTKTVASLLFVLLRMKCRTLTCAPTNVAVLGVASRLMSLVSGALEYDTYGLGDIVLFGNGERMKIDDHEDLFDVFLANRVYALARCLAPRSGWKHNVESMICLLEDPEEMYRMYLEQEEMNKNKDEEAEEEGEEEAASFGNQIANNNEDKEEDSDNDLNDGDKREIWRRKIVQTLKKNKKKESSKREGKLKCDKREEKDNSTRSNKEKGEKVEKDEDPMTFEEFFMKRFKLFENQLIFCITNLYTHMPTSFISVEVVKKMIKALDLLKSIGTMSTRAVVNKGLIEVMNGVDDVDNMIKHYRKLSSSKTECLQILKFLSEALCLPSFTERYKIQSFCLENAYLIFCTASSSSKLHTEGMRPLELLVIDEAAQLKECESTIPLQLSGLCHAILIGDERQLPAMLCELAEFGRSLFERLVILGHKRHLLNIQYRMHPSISLFPNREFYDSKILDGPNVKERTYERRFLRGRMYGSYSFINVTHGKEEFDSRHSRKNMVEVAVVSEIVASLFKESVASKQKVRVGCISPYKAQVFALQEKLGKTYNTDSNSDFSVNVRSVDGFQGGEEDLIIISTVRCNGRGSVGFLSNHQRTNVALTRARHCLWILGNGATLINSGSVWKKLVVDAKARSCFYDAIDEKNLAQAVAGALVELNQLDTVLRTDSLLFRNTRWKVCFSDYFMKSISRIKNIGVRKEVLSILQRLSSGWDQHRKVTVPNRPGGVSSQLLELDTVNELLNLIWSVDVVSESSKDIQVLKVWDILPAAKIPELANHLDTVFGDYTVNKMNRCLCRSFEGNIVVPVTWPADSSAGTEVSRTNADYVRFLESQIASLTMKDEPGSSITKDSRYQVKSKMNNQKTEAKGMKKGRQFMKQ